MRTIPENHPVSRMFRVMTERAMSQAQLADSQVVLYVSEMLLQFLHTDNLFRYHDKTGERVCHITDMLQMAEQVDAPAKQQMYQYVGDYVLFVLGVFPESLQRPRRSSSATFYAYHGRRSYVAASELQQRSEAVHLYRKMADHFDRCVLGLNWFKEYTSDPFYQYMLREFGISA